MYVYYIYRYLRRQSTNAKNVSTSCPVQLRLLVARLCCSGDAQYIFVCGLHEWDKSTCIQLFLLSFFRCFRCVTIGPVRKTLSQQSFVETIETRVGAQPTWPGAKTRGFDERVGLLDQSQFRGDLHLLQRRFDITKVQQSRNIVLYFDRNCCESVLHLFNGHDTAVSIVQLLFLFEMPFLVRNRGYVMAMLLFIDCGTVLGIRRTVYKCFDGVLQGYCAKLHFDEKILL